MSGRAVVLELTDAGRGRELRSATPICAREGFAPRAGALTLWDGQGSYETNESKRRRQASALRLCNVCPVLEECRRWLADVDEKRILVDGVVAGTVRAWRRSYHASA